jgi:hypothetical protein
MQETGRKVVEPFFLESKYDIVKNVPKNYPKQMRERDRYIKGFIKPNKYQRRGLSKRKTLSNQQRVSYGALRNMP